MFRILRFLEGADSRRLLPPAALVMLPAFFLGFFGDDFFHLMVMDGKQATAVGILAYVVAYEAFGAEDGRPRRALSLAPATALAPGYFLWYRSAGYGAAPLKYLAAAPLRFLQLAGGQFEPFAPPAVGESLHFPVALRS